MKVDLLDAEIVINKSKKLQNLFQQVMFWSSALLFEESSHGFPTIGPNFSLSYKRYKWNRKGMGGNEVIFCSLSCHWQTLCFQATLLTTNVGFFWELNNQHTSYQGMNQLDPSECITFILWFPRHTWPQLLSNLSFWHPPPKTSLLSQWETFEWVNWHYDICQISILFSQLAVASILYFNWLGWNYHSEFPSWRV